MYRCTPVFDPPSLQSTCLELTSSPVLNRIAKALPWCTSCAPTSVEVSAMRHEPPSNRTAARPAMSVRIGLPSMTAKSVASGQRLLSGQRREAYSFGGARQAANGIGMCVRRLGPTEVASARSHTAGSPSKLRALFRVALRKVESEPRGV